MRQANIPLTFTTGNSQAIYAAYLLYISVQAVATSAMAGTLQMQASNDEQPGATLNDVDWQPTNWTNVSGVDLTVSGTGTALIPKTDVCYQYIRFVYTNSGTGTPVCTLKTIGA